jgi:hypothetical protein
MFLSYLTGARCVLSAVSVLVVAHPSSEVPEGFMNNRVCVYMFQCFSVLFGLYLEQGGGDRRIIVLLYCCTD